MVKKLFNNAKISYTDVELEEMTDKLNIMISVVDKVREFDGEEYSFEDSPICTQQLRSDVPEVSMSELKVGRENFHVPSVMSGEVDHEA